ncbi:uncharacterized protein BO96DRAFT_418028 [Aspergillus niger CBS 101883]|uniref:uncharacterized protein n=1 Tax=Aspergillus lacticoffeatus (strain CBS 101883) TaxID=1450533 RepID=UPI000D7EEEAA|nr:uncharacterized protein BO96DRAFT_418028 [Aspergillus niger CBS 101883]PYH62534.1 hypothetical protein BO96DRAFT_418028 [Aspergillus niger CBS 101883]
MASLLKATSEHAADEGFAYEYAPDGAKKNYWGRIASDWTQRRWGIERIMVRITDPIHTIRFTKAAIEKAKHPITYASQTLEIYRVRKNFQSYYHTQRLSVETATPALYRRSELMQLSNVWRLEANQLLEAYRNNSRKLPKDSQNCHDW